MPHQFSQSSSRSFVYSNVNGHTVTKTTVCNDGECTTEEIDSSAEPSNREEVQENREVVQEKDKDFSLSQKEQSMVVTKTDEKDEKQELPIPTSISNMNEKEEKTLELPLTDSTIEVISRLQDDFKDA